MSDQYLSVREVAAMMNCSNSSVWNLAKSGTFPKPVKFSPRLTRWKLSEINEYINNLASH